MSALSVEPPYPAFAGADGQPLENGYIWIGEANLDPQGNPINVYWDVALTIAAPQPIRTLNGYPSRNGTPARLYVNSDYSIRVQNSKGSLVYSAPEATERYSGAVFNGINASQVIYDPAGTGAVSRSVQSRLRDFASVFDFIPEAEHAAIQAGTSIYDCTADFANAFAAHNQLFFPEGTYLVDATGYPIKRAIFYSTSVDNIVLSGYGATIKYKNTATGPIGLNFVEIVNANNVLIEGLTFDGNRQNQNFGYHAIAFSGGKNLTVRDVYAKNMYFDGIYVRASNVNDSNTYPEHVLIDNVVCDACGRNGTSIIGANGIIVQNSLFKNTVGDPGAGLDVEPNVSDIYGVRNLMIDNCTFIQNRGRGLVITGNVPASPSDTPYCINARITNTIAGKNSVGQNVSIGGSDIAVFYAENISIDGYSNTVGESYDPMDAGLIFIFNTVKSISLANLFFNDCNFTTNTKTLVYIDSSNNDYRSINGVYAVNCNGVIVSGGRYTSISNVQGQNCTGSISISVGSIDSSLRDVTLVNCPVLQARNSAGTGLQTLESLTIIDPVGDALRLFGTNSTYRNITIRNTGTAAARAVWLESLTNCTLDNWNITDNGGYWATPANAYLVSQASLTGNNIRNLFPSPLSGSTTWNPASIAPSGSTSTTVSLLRSDIGDPCVAKHSVSLQGLITFASTTSANTSTVTLFNPTGGAIDLASHTVSVEAIK